jgi:hypothetical protein
MTLKKVRQLHRSCQNTFAVHPHFGCVDFLFFDRVQDCLKRQFLAVEPAQVNYWEIIADKLTKAGWSWGCLAPGSPNNEFRVFFNGVMIFDNPNANSGFSPFSFPNLVATGSLTTLEFQGRNAIGADYVDDVDLTPTPAANVGGIGYWANHPEAWCVLTITLGCQNYTQAEAIAIMLHPTNKDMTYQLAAQLAAAELNVDCAFADSSCVASAIAAADSWLCSHPIGSNEPKGEFKEHRKVEEQEATIAQVKSKAAKQEATIALLRFGMEVLTATVKEQASQIQKVSAQLEVTKAAPQTVLNNQ